MEWIKKHPYLLGALVLGIILWFILRSAKNSSAAASAQPVSPTATPQYALAALQSGTQLQGAQIAATAQQNQTNAQLAATQIQAATQLQEAQLAQQAQIQNIVTSGQVQTGQTNAALQAVQAQVGGQVQIANTQAEQNVQLATISTQGQLGLAQTAAEVQNNITNAQVQQAQIAGQTQTAIAGYAAQTQQDIANQQAAATINGQNVAGQVQIAGINSQTTLGLGAQGVQNNAIAAQLAATLGQQGVENNYISTSGNVAGEAIQGQVTMQQQMYQNQQQTLDLLAAHGKLGGSSTGVTQILSAVQGQGPVALASTNPGAYGGPGFSIPGIFSFNSNGPAPSAGNGNSFLTSLFG